MDVVAATVTKPKFIMEDMRPPVKLVEVKPPQPRQVDDDWFVLLDVAAKKSGILPFHVVPTVRQIFQYMLKWNLRRFCVYLALVSVDERVRMYPEVRPAKEFAATEQRITKKQEKWQQEKVLQQKPRPAVREMEDDWYILLDLATKKSGIIKMI